MLMRFIISVCLFMGRNTSTLVAFVVHRIFKATSISQKLPTSYTLCLSKSMLSLLTEEDRKRNNEEDEFDE